MSERFDIILFGVTGLVGRYTFKHLYKISREKGIKWGIAGRNEGKIKEMLKKMEKELNVNLKNIPIIEANMYDESSIKSMTSKCKILLTACGPLRKTGEIVVKCCIETKTNYADVSAEENYFDKIFLNYNEKAKDAGVFIVNACGIDAFLYDIGLIHLQEIFPGTLNSVETQLKVGQFNKDLDEPTCNKSTWVSAIDLILNKKELKMLKTKLPPLKLPNLKPILNPRKIPFKSDIEKGYTINMQSTDRAIMLKTQEYLYEKKNLRPVQVQTYLVCEKFSYIFRLIFFGILFVSLVYFKFGRKLLLKYPTFFSSGLFSNEEPSEEALDNVWTRFTFIGQGWKGKLLKSNENCDEKPNSKMVIQMKTVNPGYGATGLCLALAGFIMATEKQKLPEIGGVLTPGVVFYETSVIKLLEENGLKYEIIS